MARRNQASRADRTGSPGRGRRHGARVRAAFLSRPVLLLAFAFAVMGDPVSSVAYAMEAGLRSLGGRLALLLPTMLVVLAIIVLVAVNYHQLYAMFPGGGGDAAASAKAFSEGLAFLPLAALIVDYALTIAISVAAGASAIIAYLPRLAPARVPLALVLLVFVAGVTLFGHGGRAVFALMTISFVIIGSVVIVLGARAVPVHHAAAGAAPASGSSAPVAVLLAFPVGMALATGVEAPSSAIAQLGQLDDTGRLRFGRTTLWLMVAIVVWLTVGLTAVGARLDVGTPPGGSTWIAQVAQAAVGRGALFAAFQLSSAVLLLAAASSSFQAGPGLLKALARGGGGVGILPAFLSRRNRHHTPYWGVAVFLATAAILVVAAAGQEQRLVLFYAVAVFIAFWCGLASMTRLFHRARRRWLTGVSVTGGLAVGVTLGTDFVRGYPIVSFIAACLIAAILYAMWVRAGRPRGVAQAERIAEAEDEPASKISSA
jgi:amino acid permease-like protein